MELVCRVFDVLRSCLYAYRVQARHIDVERMALSSRVHDLFVDSRSSAGSRSITGMLREEGTRIGRFKVSHLMEELGLICEQPGRHSYKQPTVERVDIPYHLNRQFMVDAPNHVWYGDITYVWAQSRWNYLAVVLDLFTRGVVGWAFSTRPDADLVVQALEMAYEQRGRPQGLLFHSDQGSQYAGRKFRQRLWRYRIQQSMSRRGNCWERAACPRGTIRRWSDYSAALKANGCRQWVTCRRKKHTGISVTTSCIATTGYGRISSIMVWGQQPQKKNLNPCPGSVDHYSTPPAAAMGPRYRKRRGASQEPRASNRITFT